MDETRVFLTWKNILLCYVICILTQCNAMYGICLCNSMYGQGFCIYAMVSMNIVLCMDMDYFLSLKKECKLQFMDMGIISNDRVKKNNEPSIHAFEISNP